MLINLLGDHNLVKIITFIAYTKQKKGEIANKINVDENEFKRHIKMLLELNLIVELKERYKPNYQHPIMNSIVDFLDVSTIEINENSELFKNILGLYKRRPDLGLVVTNETGSKDLYIKLKKFFYISTIEVVDLKSFIWGYVTESNYIMKFMDSFPIIQKKEIVDLLKFFNKRNAG